MTWPEIVEWFDQNTWIGTVFLIVFATLLCRLILKFVFDHIERGVSVTENLYDDAVIHAARLPIGWMILLYGLLWAATVLRAHTEAGVLQFIPQVREVGTIVLMTWFALRVIRDVADAHAEVRENIDSGDVATIKTISKLLRVSVVITSFLICLQALGFSITGVLAFGGVGGIAVGFAARDLLANFFGTVGLLMDKPFKVGDKIRSTEVEIEGFVEDIGWRVTLIRTLDKRPLYVPNSVFTNIPIENSTRMTNRHINETIGVRYEDINVLPRILEDLREMLRQHKEIDKEQHLIVNLNEFGPSSVDVLIYTFTKTTDRAFFHEIKEDVLLKASAIIENHGAEIAFPTQTLYVEPVTLQQTSNDEAD